MRHHKKESEIFTNLLPPELFGKATYGKGKDNVL